MRHIHSDENDNAFAYRLIEELIAAGRETAAMMLSTFVELDERGLKLETCTRLAIQAAAQLEVPQHRRR